MVATGHPIETDPTVTVLDQLVGIETSSVPELRSIVTDTGDQTSAPVNEGRLIAAAQRDPAAFQPLYERYVDQIYRYIYRRVGTHDEAEDLTAQTFQQALAALPNYEWRGVPFGSWLYRIAGNLVIRHRRVRGREIAMNHVERIVDERGSFDDPLEAILRQTSRDQLYTAMRELSSDQQRALVLKYVHGLKNCEVGVALGRTEGGIKQLVHRAIVALRAAMRPAPSDPEADVAQTCD